MKTTDLRATMWSDVLKLLDRAEAMHRQMFEPVQQPGDPRSRRPFLEPPLGAAGAG